MTVNATIQRKYTNKLGQMKTQWCEAPYEIFDQYKKQIPIRKNPKAFM